MTSKEFVIWLKGFTKGVHDFNVTPKQWDLLKDTLAEVSDDEKFVETPGMFQVHQPPPYPGIQLDRVGTDHDLVKRYPWGGQVVWAGSPIPCSGSVSLPSVWTSTTSGSNINYTITSASAWSGGTTYTYPNGTTITYTTGDHIGIKDFSPSDKLDIAEQTNDKILLND